MGFQIFGTKHLGGHQDPPLGYCDTCSAPLWDGLICDNCGEANDK